MIQNGQKVSLRYTLTIDDGTVVDSNADGEPMVYEHGADQILPALEAHLAEQEIGATSKITLAAADGYGEIVDEAIHEVPLAEIPDTAREVGVTLTATDNEGNSRPVRVKAVGDETVTLDFNHPLAGQALHFEVEVIGVE